MLIVLAVTALVTVLARWMLKRRVFQRRLIIRGLCVALGFNLLAAGFFVHRSFGAGVTKVERAEGGTGSSIRTLIVDIPGVVKRRKVEIEVSDRALTKEEEVKALNRCRKKLPKVVLGKNKSAESVTEDLTFPSAITGNPTKITWLQDRYDVVDGQGVIDRDKLSDEGEDVVLTAHLTCGSTEDDLEIPVTVVPRRLESSRGYLDEIRRQFAKADQSDQTKKSVSLPAKIEGKSVRWRNEESGAGYLIMLIGLAAAAAMIASWRAKQKQEAAVRREMLAEDYPKILNLFSMLLRAGMTSGHAWAQIVSDYEERKADDGSRPAYEAMALCVRKIRAGEPGGQVYRDFGLICRDTRYETFGNLIAGNLRRGSAGLADQTARQARSALEERKAAAVRKGEEAQIKLLGPMMLLLAVVLISVMVPAFLAMRM